MRSRITGCGVSVPERLITNEELSLHLDTSDAWIFERTGIHARHIASSETVASLGAEAAQQALEKAGCSADEVDGIILATTSPDDFLPSTATKIQALLGARRAFAFDLQAVCSGFLYALSVADQFIRAGNARNLLVIGADLMSRMLDWTDRSTCVLFGDGAGAVLVQASQDTECGILTTHLFADGTAYNELRSDASIQTKSNRGGLVMNGRQVYIKAIELMEASVRLALEKQHLSVESIDWFVAHQANKRILDAVARNLKLPEDKVVCTMETFANTSAASIPMALATAVNDGRIQPGHLVVMTANGAGFTWGSAIVRW